MGKRVVIIASGETERRSLPHLVEHLQAQDIVVTEVRIPPGHRSLNVQMAEKLVKAAWFDKEIDARPDKFVVLVDTNGMSAEDVLSPFQDQLAGRIGPNVTAQLQLAYAQRHLEAWYFADESGLRKYLGGSLGSIDASAPDQIENPKEHLKNLLGETAYTAVISEGIAKALEAQRISQRSPSFQGFLDAVRNGSPTISISQVGRK